MQYSPCHSPSNAVFSAELLYWLHVSSCPVFSTTCHNCLHPAISCLSLWLLTLCFPCDKWVPVTTAWRVLRLRMEERSPIWRVAANILNKQSRTADKEWSSSLGVGRGANNSSLWKRVFFTKRSQTKPRTWTDTLVRPKVADTCDCGNEPSGSIKCGYFLTSCKPVSFSRNTLLHGVGEWVSEWVIEWVSK
jgi:hypothetical protein